MQMLFLVKGAIGLMALAAVLIAVAGLKRATMLPWHRRVGWAALGGFVLCSVLELLVDGRAFALEPWYLHVILSLPCAVAVLSKAWARQRKAKWGKSQVLSWCAVASVAGSSLLVLACALAARRHPYAPAVWDRGKGFAHQTAVWGHIVLTFVLIWLGHLALRGRATASSE